MRGRHPKIDHLRNDLLYQVDAAKNLELAVRRLSGIRSGSQLHLHPRHVLRIVELAFMGVCAAWEDFLENVMVRYLAGAKTKSGFTPTLRIGKCEGIRHAYEILSAKPGYDPEEQYLTWTNPTAVASLAEVFFVGGAPFKAPLTREVDRLKKAVRIRNRIAHGSPKCKAEFHDTANAIMQRPMHSRLGQGYRAGKLLSVPATAFFGAGVPEKNITVFDAYMEMYKALAREIVPS